MECGFVHDLNVDGTLGSMALGLDLVSGVANQEVSCNGEKPVGVDNSFLAIYVGVIVSSLGCRRKFT